MVETTLKVQQRKHKQDTLNWSRKDKKKCILENWQQNPEDAEANNNMRDMFTQPRN